MALLSLIKPKVLYRKTSYFKENQDKTSCNRCPTLKTASFSITNCSLTRKSRSACASSCNVLVYPFFFFTDLYVDWRLLWPPQILKMTGLQDQFHTFHCTAPSWLLCRLRLPLVIMSWHILEWNNPLLFHLYTPCINMVQGSCRAHE